MKHKDWDYAVIAAMFLCGVYTAITGLAMDVLNMPLVVFHAYAGYACSVLAGIHVILNWKKIRFLEAQGWAASWKVAVRRM